MILKNSKNQSRIRLLKISFCFRKSNTNMIYNHQHKASYHITFHFDTSDYNLVGLNWNQLILYSLELWSLRENGFLVICAEVKNTFRIICLTTADLSHGIKINILKRTIWFLYLIIIFVVRILPPSFMRF